MQPRNVEVINDYYEWLCEIVRANTFERSYWLLIKTLHKKPFFWSVPNDDNRAEDGKKLREDFIRETGSKPFLKEFLDEPCTMLEMLIGLAKRMEELTADVEEGDRTVEWFWTILQNCGLGGFTDEAYEDLGGVAMVHYILDKVLGRTYKRNGDGGLFPLKYSKKDQRKVEIWYQMCEYIIENYYREGEKV